MPVGNDASPELLPSPEQRAEVYRRIRDYRSRKPLFCMDFQNDAEFVDGCIAGGRRYLHINANGDADPCAFIHYAKAARDRGEIRGEIHGYAVSRDGRAPVRQM